MKRLDDLGRRIERIALAPGDVRAPFTRLARLVLRRFGWRPVFRVASMQALVEAMERGPLAGQETGPDAWRKELAAALKELDDNVVAGERACVLEGGLAVASSSWLRRLYEVVTRVARVAQAPRGAAAVAIDPIMLVPPLVVTPPALDAAGAAAEGARPIEEPVDKGAARLVDLQLAAIDHLIDAAREEPEFLDRRRRLLEAARQMLLDSAAAMPLDPGGVEKRRRWIAEHIVRIDRLQGAGIDPAVSLRHQAQRAVAAGDRRRLHAALVAMNAHALSLGDAATAGRSADALSIIAPAPMHAERHRQRSLERSQRELLGEEVVREVQSAAARGRAALRPPVTAEDREIHGLALEYLAPGAEKRTLPLALAADGCFEVGGTLSPVRIIESHLRARVVPWPTQDMHLVPAREVADIPAAVIDDPRAVMLSLAEGRLLTRKFVQYDRVERRRAGLSAEVRIYLLDGSGSMVEHGGGLRARMRDAILLAELATLIRRLDDAERQVRVVLFYRYFTHELLPVVRVDSPASALASIGDVVGKMRVGGTNIEGALVASLRQIREARAADPDLARAQMVLITDGEGDVREAAVQAAREGLEDLPVQLSVIALGQENPALRALVARQRAAGERAFYHYLSDEVLAAMVSEGIDRGASPHLPRVDDDEPGTPAERARRLREQVGELVDELVASGRPRDIEALDAAADEASAQSEMGLDAGARSEGERALAEARARDTRALQARFARWFEVPVAAPASTPSSPSSADEEAVWVALSAVGDVVSEMGGTELARRADAIDILERLLPDARLSPGRYREVLRHRAPTVMRALEAVHAAVRTKPSAVAPGAPAQRR